MSCPKCGSSSIDLIGPALYRCTNMLYDRVTVPPPIGRPFSMTYQDVAWQCGYVFREGSPQPGEVGCPEHGIYSTGSCPGCRALAVCAMCGRGKCRACRGVEEALDAQARREQQAREEAAAQARKDAHAVAVRANEQRYATSQQQCVAELRSISRELAAVNGKLRGSLKFAVSHAFSAVVGLGFWIVALLIIVKTPVKVISVFPFTFGLAFMSPVIMQASAARRRTTAARLSGRRDALLETLGCGEDCEYGCRRY